MTENIDPMKSTSDGLVSGASTLPEVVPNVSVPQRSSMGGTSSSAKAPNFMASRRVLPELVESAIERGIRVFLTKVGYELEGFYKSGPMRLEPSGDGGLHAVDRKEQSTPVKTFDDLVRLNYDCWKKSRDKGTAYINPGKEWLDEFARLNLVKRQVIFVPGED